MTRDAAVFEVAVRCLSGECVRVGAVEIAEVDGFWLVCHDQDFAIPRVSVVEWLEVRERHYVARTEPDFSPFGAAASFVDTVGLDAVETMLRGQAVAA